MDKGILKVFRRGEYIVYDKMLGEYLQRKSQITDDFVISVIFESENIESG